MAVLNHASSEYTVGPENAALEDTKSLLPSNDAAALGSSAGTPGWFSVGPPMPPPLLR